MNYDLISFDAQGTLTDAVYSDAFWRDLLPAAYAAALDVSPSALPNLFKLWGPADPRYYDTELWLTELFGSLPLADLMRANDLFPRLYPDMLDLLEQLHPKTKLIVISSTTHSFLDLELRPARHLLDRVFSTIDDFDTPAKPPHLYTAIARHYSTPPDRCLHIGDRIPEDVDSPRLAGWHSRLLDPDPASRAALREFLGLPSSH